MSLIYFDPEPDSSKTVVSNVRRVLGYGEGVTVVGLGREFRPHIRHTRKVTFLMCRTVDPEWCLDTPYSPIVN